MKKIRIKRLLGLCEGKGCFIRKDYDAELTVQKKDGTSGKYIFGICQTHAMEFAKRGYLKSVEFEDGSVLTVEREERNAESLLSD